MSTVRDAPPAEILLVEDSPTDVLLTREALADMRLANVMTVVSRGEDALALLYDPEVRRPDLMLLDLNLPGISGLEVLTRIKQDVHLRKLPVVILTTSSAEEDVDAAYRGYANAFVRKPVRFEEFIRAVSEIGDFWLHLVSLPGPNGLGQR